MKNVRNPTLPVRVVGRTDPTKTTAGTGRAPRAVPATGVTKGARARGTLDVVDDAPPPQIDTSGPLFERVAEAMEQIRPHIQADGGDVRLVEIEDECIAIIELSGACVGCPMSEITIRHGIEGTLRVLVPEIMGVDVVDNGTEPARTFTDVLERATFKPL